MARRRSAAGVGGLSLALDAILATCLLLTASAATDFCSSDPCFGATCTDLGNTWSCGPCPNYMYPTTKTVDGVRGHTCDGHNAGYYIGCFADGGAGILPALLATRDDMTPRICAAMARAAGYTLYGVQSGKKCFAGTDVRRVIAFGNGARPYCTTPCSGDATKMCGGTGFTNVYSLSDYLGCYADSSATRMVQAPMYDGRVDRFMTPQICRDRARSRGFTLFSVQDGYGCFGGYATNLDYATKLGYSSSCNKTCRGEGYQICGGFWTNSIYLTGDAIISAPNLALARPAYASSVYTTAAVAYLPAKAVDGVVQYFTGLNETNPQVFASAANDRSPWISVDLAAPTVILSIVIWNRCDFYWRNLQNAELRIGNASITVPGDSISSNPLVWTQNKQLGMCAAEIVMFDTPKVGRWVTLQNRNPTALNLDYSLQLTELQVFGF